jgi:hypothetical protein
MPLRSLDGHDRDWTSFDCIEKVLITERFCEELYGPPFIACTLIGISPCAVMKTMHVRVRDCVVLQSWLHSH